ncbi:MAG: hypothetical protein OFPI_35470 [Osedax symbiont Rs2]|nr:MAG: hypothetical protein OFPI_35470 [Osedax symbiont Rs2]
MPVPALKQPPGEKGLLLAFIYNHCPYVRQLIDSPVADFEY